MQQGLGRMEALSLTRTLSLHFKQYSSPFQPSPLSSWIKSPRPSVQFLNIIRPTRRFQWLLPGNCLNRHLHRNINFYWIVIKNCQTRAKHSWVHILNEKIVKWMTNVNWFEMNYRWLYVEEWRNEILEHSHVRLRSEMAGVFNHWNSQTCSNVGKVKNVSGGLAPPLAFSLVDGLRNRIFLPDWTLDKLLTGVGVYRTPMIICCHGFFQALLNLLFVFIKCLITLCGRPAAGLLLGVTQWGPRPRMLTKWKAIARQLLRHYIDAARVFFYSPNFSSTIQIRAKIVHKFWVGFIEFFSYCPSCQFFRLSSKTPRHLNPTENIPWILIRFIKFLAI